MERRHDSQLIRTAGAILFTLTASFIAPGPGAAVAADEAVEASYWYVVDHLEVDAPGPDAPPARPRGGEVELWLALPPDRDDQEVVIESISPEPTRVLTDDGSGLQVAHWRLPVAAGTERLFFRIDFAVTPHPARPQLSAAEVTPYDTTSATWRRYTRSEHLLETGGEVGAQARRIVGSERNPYLRARAVFDWVVENVAFGPDGPDERDAAAVLAAGRGDCDQVSTLFAALCRAAGVPARTVQCTWFQGGSHRHAEFYLEDHGWLPADPVLAQVASGGSAIDPVDARGFLQSRGIPADDPGWLFGNGFDGHLHVSAGQNLRLVAEDGTTAEFTWLAPGGNQAEPSAFRARGVGDAMVHGGFYVFGRRLPDESVALSEAYQQLATAYFSAGDYEEVEATCLGRVRRGGDAFMTWMNLGRVYLAKGAYYRAESAFQRALTSPAVEAPHETEAVIWTRAFLGHCYDLLGKRDMALREYRHVVEQGADAGGAVAYARRWINAPFTPEDRLAGATGSDSF
ncbi:MAG: transglutaminase domain-containing protein [Candidatus Krumholzibacteriia bacterium]